MFQTLPDAIDCNRGRFFQRITVGARADSGKADGADTVFLGQVQAGAVTIRQLLGFTVLPVVINRANRMKNVLGRQRSRARGYGASGGTSAGNFADFVQLPLNGGTARPMDGSIHSAPGPQTPIRGIDHSIDADLGDIADH